MFFHDPLQCNYVLLLQGRVNQQQVGPEVFRKAVGVAGSPREHLEEGGHSLFLLHGEVDIGAIYLGYCLLDQAWPDLNLIFFLPAIQKEQLFPPVTQLDRQVIINHHVPPYPIFTQTDVVSPKLIVFLLSEQTHHFQRIFCKNAQSTQEVRVRVLSSPQKGGLARVEQLSIAVVYF